jgi:hypothetical protein
MFFKFLSFKLKFKVCGREFFKLLRVSTLTFEVCIRIIFSSV